jgi:hypothetical protein
VLALLLLLLPPQEALTPGNQKDILAAAKVAGTVIPVHVYLYSHYENAYGYNFTTPQQLQALVDSLDPRYIKVVGANGHVARVVSQTPTLEGVGLQQVCNRPCH